MMSDSPSKSGFSFPREPEAAEMARLEETSLKANVATAKILIVDDEPTSVKVFRKYLLDAGYSNIVTNTEPTRTLAIIDRESPDLILLDIVMPEVSGLDILEAVRCRKGCEHTPVIILTAFTDLEAKMRAFDLGATDFLHKPVEPTDLVPRVRNAIRIKAFHDYYLEQVTRNDRPSPEQAQRYEECGEVGGGDGEQLPVGLEGRQFAQTKLPVFPLAGFQAMKATAKVLVVDDEPINCKVVTKYLTAEGYQRVVSISRPTEAIPAVYREMPDVVLLDIMMPDIGGLAILERLRADETLMGLPVIILTASTDQATKRHAFELGATEFLTKPVDPVELLPRIKNALLVKAYQDHLQDYARTLEHEVAERVKEIGDYAVALQMANEMLRSSRDAAQSANRAKSEFLANMSHEIRTPLTAIIGFGELMMADLQARSLCDKDVSYVETIVRNGRHLLDVVNDILDVSKIEAGRLSTEMASCSPFAIGGEVVRSLQLQAERQGKVQLSLEHEGPLPETIRTDAVCLRRILVNVIGNALKFTERGSVRVVLRLEHEQGEPFLEFQVIDTGVGIAPKDLARLFKPFVQADTSVTRRFGGTGLGLAISKHLAETLNGRITVESELGKGSIFHIFLPTGPLEGVRLLDDPLVAVSEIPRGDRKASQPPEGPDLPCRVLLAEDSRDNRELIRLMLENDEVDVEQAENGQVAYEKALTAAQAGTPFDVILMDMEMPVLDGYSAVRRLKEAGYTYPIIALTAHAVTGSREKCLAAGCDDYLSKPINFESLWAMVRRYASARRAAINS